MERLSDDEIKRIYQMICNYYDKYLKQYGVKLPKLISAKGYTKDALILICLAQSYPNTRPVSKGKLTEFIRQYYVDVADVQQARHLAAQNGWFIVSGTRGNKDVELKPGEYQLISLERPYPAFVGQRVEDLDIKDWEGLKERYGNRCATCGSKEGEPNIHWPNSITQLQKAHKNPNKPLISRNIIPQCQFCNRAYRNWWVFDDKGRVRELANPSVITRSDERVRWEVYKILYNEFKGRNPNE